MESRKDLFAVAVGFYVFIGALINPTNDSNDLHCIQRLALTKYFLYAPRVKKGWGYQIRTRTYHNAWGYNRIWGVTGKRVKFDRESWYASAIKRTVNRVPNLIFLRSLKICNGKEGNVEMKINNKKDLHKEHSVLLQPNITMLTIAVKTSKNSCNGVWQAYIRKINTTPGKNS